MEKLQLLGRFVPPRAIIGLLSESAGAISEHLRSLAPLPGSELVIVNYELDARDPLAILRSKRGLVAARHRGATVLLASYREELLEELCDEIWWIEGSEVRMRGNASEVLKKWRRHIVERWQAEQTGVAVPLAPSLEIGDGRARIEAVELRDEAGEHVGGWASAAPALVRVVVKFLEHVEDPVIGMLIRTRIGLNVYGTNTELEHLKLGPREAGDRLELLFRFRADICPGEYTVTVASHDPDGTWHEWLEDVVAFTVTDTRYTAGVANLRALIDWRVVLSDSPVA